MIASRVSAFLSVFVLIAGATLQAQTPSSAHRSVYIYGGYGVGWQNGATEDGSYDGLRSPGGGVHQWWVGAGTNLRREVALEAGVERTGLVDSIQYRYFGHGDYEGTLLQRRNTVFFFNGRYVRQRGAVGWEPFGTLGFLWEQSWRAKADGYTHGGLTKQDFPDPVPYANRFALVAGAGVDLRIGGGPVAIVPGFRFCVFAGGGDTWRGGATTWSEEARIAVRVAF